MRGDTSPPGEARILPTLAVVALLAACTGNEAADAAACTEETVVERPLILPNALHAYVEPNNLMRVGDDVVVVGVPTYTWRVGGDTVRMASQDRHIAAYLDEEAPRLVEMPIDVPVGMVRSVALDDRRWAVLFSEQSRDETSRPIGEVLRLWYGEYDGARWTTLEELPLPDRALFGGSPSGLADHDGVIHWAVVRRGLDGVFHYRRRDGRWSFGLAEEQSAEAASIAAGPAGLFLAISGLDPDVANPIKTVRLFHWDAGWHLVSRDPTAEPYSNIRDPSVIVLADGATVTWIEIVGNGVVMSRVGVTPDNPGTLHVLDRSASFVRPFATERGEPVWLLRHHTPVATISDLRIMDVDADTVRVRQFIPDPYTGYFAALAAGPDEVIVTGSEFSPRPSRPTVRSLTLRLSPSCR
jgi:hypothetical protein